MSLSLGKTRTGHPGQTDLREVIKALRYIVRSGCEWHTRFKSIHDLALISDRLPIERTVPPTAGVTDSQSVKAPTADKRGYDASKNIKGRKRHIAIDTDGWLLAMNLTPADVANSKGASMMLDALKELWPWVKHLFGDAVYDRRKLMDKAVFLDFTVEVVRRLEGQSGFAWQRWRQLVRDYEQRINSWSMMRA